MTNLPIDRDQIAAAEKIIRPHIRRTPILEVAGADFGLDSISLIFKLEFLQHAGSFKSRGAFTNLLTRDVPKAGVVAASGGNHGVAVAFAAGKLGVPAKIFLPTVASPEKIDRIRRSGADLVIVGDRYADALAASEAWMAQSGAMPIHAFDQMETLLGQGTVGLELDNTKTPCTVNNFTSLAKQGFFDNTTCHRLTTSTELGALQCGDPTTTGTGGPGYRFPNEYPTNQYRLTDPALKVQVLYPRGTLAMANSGPGTNGSQFFLVYKDSRLPPTYTVFGTIDSAGLATLDKVAAGGVADGSDDGKPVVDATIKSVQVG